MMAEMTHEVEPEGATPGAMQYKPMVHIEVSEEQLKELEVGQEVTMKIRGKVKKLGADDVDEANKRFNVCLDLQSVSIDPEENEFTRLAEDD